MDPGPKDTPSPCQTNRSGATIPTLLIENKSKGGFKSVSSRPENQRSLAKFICKLPQVGCGLHYRGFGGKGAVWTPGSGTALLALVLSGHPTAWRLPPEAQKEHTQGGQTSGWIWVILLLTVTSFMFSWVHFIGYHLHKNSSPNTYSPFFKRPFHHAVDLPPLGPTQILPGLAYDTEQATWKQSSNRYLVPVYDATWARKLVSHTW